MPTITCPQCSGHGTFEGGPCDLCAGGGKVTVRLHPVSLPRIRPITHALENRLADQIRLAGLPDLSESTVSTQPASGASTLPGPPSTLQLRWRVASGSHPTTPLDAAPAIP
jgi:hypothetical protein